MSGDAQYFRSVKHWYPEDFPYDIDEESIERLNSVVPIAWGYMVSYDEDPGVYLLEYVGELNDG